LSITTQTNDRRSLCFEEYDYARKVRDGEVIDPTYLPVLY
jgi:phage terminase large subunit-like protein